MPSLSLRRFADPAAFRRVVEPFLERREATHCLQLGLLAGLEAGAWPDPFLAAVERDGTPVLVAMRTPPHDLILSHADDPRTAAFLARALSGSDAPPGVLGPVEAADAFAAERARRAGAEGAVAGPAPALVMRQRVHRAERIEAPVGVPGRPRRAGAEDLDLLAAWFAAFQAEALPDEPSDGRRLAERWLDSSSRELWLWEVDGAPASMAGSGNPTRHGIRVSAVYTPPAARGNGYASAVVAHASRRRLERGRTFCFLFTDLANPTSNRIYARLGYRPVNDVHRYRLKAA